MSPVERLDDFQRRHSVISLPLAAIYKFFDDRGAYLAALITYYGFVSLFPLFLLLLTILGFVLHGNPALQHRVVSSALIDFPIVGPQLRNDVSGYTGSDAAVIIGIVGVLYGGIGVTQAAQAVFNRIYAVPRVRQPDPLFSRLRSLLLLLILGSGVLVTTGLSALVSTANAIGSQLGVGLNIAARLLTVCLDVLLFVGAFQLLTARELRPRQVFLGGLIAGVAWYVLQVVGTGYLSTRLVRAQELYGAFGLVLGTIAWIYLEALVVVFCAELNVVLSDHLWPRALLGPFSDKVELTDADRRVYSLYSSRERYKGYQRIDVSFDRRSAESAVRAGSAGADSDAAQPGAAQSPAAQPQTEKSRAAEAQVTGEES